MSRVKSVLNVILHAPRVFKKNVLRKFFPVLVFNVFWHLFSLPSISWWTSTFLEFLLIFSWYHGYRKALVKEFQKKVTNMEVMWCQRVVYKFDCPPFIVDWPGVFWCVLGFKNFSNFFLSVNTIKYSWLYDLFVYLYHIFWQTFT